MDVEFYQIFFLCLLRLSCGFHLFFFDVLYHTDWFVYAEPSFWPRDGSNLVVVCDLFCVLLDLQQNVFRFVTKMCWAFLYLYSSKTLVCSFFFFLELCLILLSRWRWLRRKVFLYYYQKLIQTKKHKTKSYY